MSFATFWKQKRMLFCNWYEKEIRKDKKKLRHNPQNQLATGRIVCECNSVTGTRRNLPGTKWKTAAWRRDSASSPSPSILFTPTGPPLSFFPLPLIPDQRACSKTMWLWLHKSKKTFLKVLQRNLSNSTTATKSEFWSAAFVYTIEVLLLLCYLFLIYLFSCRLLILRQSHGSRKDRR